MGAPKAGNREPAGRDPDVLTTSPTALDVRYGTAPSQRARLWLPGESGLHPVAVVIHGGFWRKRYGMNLMTNVCRDLASRGWAACNLEYRRVGEPGGGWPGTFADVTAGMSSLAQLADDRQLGLSQVVPIGHSAGGQLALWAAAAARENAWPESCVTAAVSLAGVTDLREASQRRLGGGAADDLLGGDPERFPERYAAASPIERVPLGVPQLLVHGARDRTVPPSMSENYAKAGRSAGDRVTLVVLPEIGHFELIDPDSPTWAHVVAWLEDVVL